MGADFLCAAVAILHGSAMSLTELLQWVASRYICWFSAGLIAPVLRQTVCWHGMHTLAACAGRHQLTCGLRWMAGRPKAHAAGHADSGRRVDHHLRHEPGSNTFRVVLPGGSRSHSKDHPAAPCRQWQSNDRSPSPRAWIHQVPRGLARCVAVALQGSSGHGCRG